METYHQYTQKSHSKAYEKTCKLYKVSPFFRPFGNVVSSQTRTRSLQGIRKSRNKEDCHRDFEVVPKIRPLIRTPKKKKRLYERMSGSFY